jgi:hypothetical protein
LKEENRLRRRLRDYGDMVLWKILAPESYEVTGEWRRVPNEEFLNLYCQPNIIRVISLKRMKWAGHVERMGERRGAYRDLVENPEGKRPLRISRHRWEDNIKMDF